LPNGVIWPFLILGMERNTKVFAFTFLDARFNIISAIWDVGLNGGSVIGNSESLAVIRSPNALNPIPLGILPADSEFVVNPYGEDEYLLKKIESQDMGDG
jgi:hypothetical protein